MKTTRTLLRALPLLSLLPIALAAGACSSEGDGDGGGDGDGDGPTGPTYCAPAGTCPPSVEGVDLTTPVSFKTDIYDAYFVSSCGGGAGCHGRSPGSANIFLGTPASPLDAAGVSALINQLINANSEIAPGQKNVVPGDWQSSFLMAKLDGCQNSYGLACNAESPHLVLSLCGAECGDGMPATEGDANNPTPFATTPEELAKVNKVRAWIAQGAQDN